MNELQVFPSDDLYEALMSSSSSLEQRLEPILKQITIKNTQFSYQAILQLHHILNSKLEPPLVKFNALQTVKMLFDTCQYSVILFLQVYLLPIIFEIAAFKATKKSEQGLSLYFIQRGAQPTKQVKRLGFNYVSLAIQFVYVTSSIKMYRLMENQELQEESHFRKIAKALKMRGVPHMLNFKFYNPTYIEHTRRVFLDKLQLFNPQSFIDFVTDLIFDELTQNKKPELDSKRLLMHGDVYVISPLVNKIQEQLNDMDENFQGKRKILTLFYELVKLGYAEAILLLNSSQFMSAITNQISKVNGDIDMDEGRWIYQQVDESQKDKKLFYLEFLKCIEVWAHAVPLNEQNEESDAKKLFNYLKYEKKFKFPQNPNIHKYKSQMEIYLRQNSERNEKVIESITRREEMDTKSARSRYRISSLKDESNVRSRMPKAGMEFEELQEIVIKAMTILEVVGFSQKRLQKDMKKLTKFKDTWHKNLEMVKKKISEDQEPYNLDMLISEGEIVYEQVVGIEKIYEQYKTNKINFEKTQQKISAFLNQLTPDNNQFSEVSVSAKSKNTRLTPRRDLKSRISQKARDMSFSDHSKYSKNSRVSQTKSARSKLGTAKKYTHTQPNIKDSPSPEKQFPKIYNPINETFALAQGEVSLAYSTKKPIIASEWQKLRKSKNSDDYKLQIQNHKKSFQPSNQYGVHQEIIKSIPITSAGFVPVNNSDFQQKIQTTKENSISPALKNTSMQKVMQSPKQRTIEKFDDSFEVPSPFRRKTDNDEKINSKIGKKQSFSRVLFNSDDENPVNEAHSSNQPKLQRVNETKDKGEGGRKKVSLIRKILSSDKINFQQNQSSSSEEQITSPRAQKNTTNNKLSNYLSFNNGNVSGYFNEQPGDEYGLGGNLKESLKQDNRVKNVVNNGNSPAERHQARSGHKVNILAFDSEEDNNKKYMNQQRPNKQIINNAKNNNFIKSNLISEIKSSQIQNYAGNFDDFHLANSKHQINLNSIIKEKPKDSSVIDSRLRNSNHHQHRLKDSRSRDSYVKNSVMRSSKNKESSLINSRIKNNLNESRNSEVYRLDITQKIKEQDSFQMLESHYKNHQVQQQKLKYTPYDEIKFVQTVQVRKQIIHDRNKVLSPSNQDQSQKTKNRMKKLLDMQNLNMKMKKQKRPDDLLEVLSERTAKRSIEDYLVEREKNKLIKNLNMRIKRLQNEEAQIQTKLSKKDEELRSISYKNYSEKHNMKFKNQNGSMGSVQNSLGEYDSNNTSLHYRLSQQNNDSQKIYGLYSGESRSIAESLVNLSIYDKFFENLSENTLKKNCLRNKSLIVSNEELEIGCMSIKKDKFINFTLFITPKLMSMKNVKFVTEQNVNLSMDFFPECFYTINAKKQESLNIKISVLNAPFVIPRIRMEYEVENMSKNPQQGRKLSLELTLPCTFNKLCSLNPINANDFYGMFNSGESRNDVKVCQRFKLNSRVFKEEKIKELFPYLSLLRRIDEHQEKSRIYYGFEANYNGNVFLVLLKIEDKKYARIEAKNMTGETKADGCLEYLMATLKKLIGN